MNVRTIAVTIVAVLLVLGAGRAAAEILLVPGEFQTIQDAIDAAAFLGDEVHVSQGVYQECIDFLSKEVRVFAPAGPGATTIEGSCYQTSVVTSTSEEGTGTILEGFTIRHNGTPPTFGAGMRIEFSSPSVINCVFADNSATFGGAVYMQGANSTFTGCTFTNNNASRGGAVDADVFADPVFIGCTFTNGYSSDNGGAISGAPGATITAVNCLFLNNDAAGDGGAIHASGTISADACIFEGNDANFAPRPSGFGHGGAIYALSAADLTNCLLFNNTGLSSGAFYTSGGKVTVTNCTFALNSALDGFAGGISQGGDHNVTIANTICYFNSPAELNGCCIQVTYSDIEGGYSGTGNIDADPQFVGSLRGTGFQLMPTSPCIDAADNVAVPGGVTLDLAGEPRFADIPDVPDTGNGGPPIVDMGAYEVPRPNLVLGPPEEFPAAGEANLHVVNDFNGDDLVDVIAILPQQQFEPNGRYQVFLNQGNTDAWVGLGAQPPDDTGQDPSGIAEGQFNSLVDQLRDMVVSNYSDDNVSIFLGNGDGTFRHLSDIDVDDGPSDVAVADVTDDGLADIMVAHDIAHNVWILEGNGDGTFSFLSEQGTGGAAPQRMDTPDIDNDKDIDIGGVNRGTSDGPGGSVFILENLGGGLFGLPQTYLIGSDPNDLSSGNLNQDGFQDIVASNEGDNTFSVLINQGDGTFIVDTPVPVGMQPLSVELVDLDNDQDDDVAVVATDQTAGPAVQVLDNIFDGNTLGFGAPQAFTVDAIPNFVSEGDFDDDSKPDLVTVNTDDGPTGGSVTVLLNDSMFVVHAGSFSYQGTLLGGGLPELHNSDNAYLRIQQYPALAPILPVIRLEIVAEAPEVAATQLGVSFETAATVVPPASLQVLSLFSYTDDAWEVVDSRIASTTDTPVQISIGTDPSRFIDQGTRSMRMRLEWFDAQDVMFLAWHSRTDRAVWLVIP